LPDGSIRRRNLDDHYAAIGAVRLYSMIPVQVQQPFETARNLYLYAFFAHRLLMVAELQVRISVEFALSARATQDEIRSKEKRGLAAMLALAIHHRWIVDVGFARFRRNEEIRSHNHELWPDVFKDLPESLKCDPQQYCKILAKNFQTIRNTLAHGSNMLYPTVLGSFEIAADIINQLFPQQQS